MCCSVDFSLHCEQLTSGVLQAVNDLLWTQIQKHLDSAGSHGNQIANFLVFVPRVISTKDMQYMLANRKWKDMLLSIVRESRNGQCCTLVCLLYIILSDFSFAKNMLKQFCHY